MAGGDDQKRWPEGMVGGDARIEVEDRLKMMVNNSLFKFLNIVHVWFTVQYTIYPICYTQLLVYLFASLYSIYHISYTPTVQVYHIPYLFGLASMGH